MRDGNQCYNTILLLKVGHQRNVLSANSASNEQEDNKTMCRKSENLTYL
jgi:hypothetical protein